MLADAVTADGRAAAPAMAHRPPALVDIEALVQTILMPRPSLPWARDDDRELSLDRGVTARPRRRPRVSWFEAEACAGMRFHTPRTRRPARDPGPDAARVIAAIRRLDPRAAAMVIACGRNRVRPDWMPGVEPRLVERRRSHRRCKPGQKRSYQIWEPCSPDAVRLVRDAYAVWYKGLVALMTALDDTLDTYRVTGLEAPARPWEAYLA